MYKNIFIIISVLISNLSIAKVPVDGVVSICSPYPIINDPTSFPKKFNLTNNLSHPRHDSFFDAEGEKIIIHGRLMDSNCVPLSDAKIYIWQANKEGYVQYPRKYPNSFPHHQKWIDPNFSGTGMTNSDNLGRFHFITIKPGSFTKVTPHIHFVVEHPKLPTLSSKFYFFDGKKSFIVDTDSDDKIFFIKNKSIINQVSAVLGDKPGNYTIDITMSDAIIGKGF